MKTTSSKRMKFEKLKSKVQSTLNSPKNLNFSQIDDFSDFGNDFRKAICLKCRYSKISS